MFKCLRLWYYRRLFLRIYFAYLKYGNDPSNAINDAFEDVMIIKSIRERF